MMGRRGRKRGARRAFAFFLNIPSRIGLATGFLSPIDNVDPAHRVIIIVKRVLNLSLSLSLSLSLALPIHHE
uniref:Putative secreted protein n=1 Tax=Anopheles marajoara TaxID=58244 RepID=A0A2M4CDS1_9DIPT